MLDLKLIREQPDAVQRGLATRGGGEFVPEILAVDANRRRLATEVETLKAERNRTSEAIGQAKRRGENPEGSWRGCGGCRTASRRSTPK